jgi:hypothetical protein
MGKIDQIRKTVIIGMVAALWLSLALPVRWSVRMGRLPAGKQGGMSLTCG